MSACAHHHAMGGRVGGRYFGIRQGHRLSPSTVLNSGCKIDFVVPDAALRKFLPAGWEPAIASQGPAKDCNIRVIFIDRADITGADGAPTGTNRLVYLAAPVKQTGGSNAGQMIIAGLSADAKEAPDLSGLRTRHEPQMTSIRNRRGRRSDRRGVRPGGFAAVSGETEPYIK